MSTPNTPSPTAHIITASPITWSDGISLFDGFILLGIALPTNSGGTYPQASNQNLYPAVRIPQWIRIPVNGGTINAQTTVDWTTSIDPPNCRYSAWWYDTNGQRIAGPSPSLFTITTDPYTITPPTLTVPTVPVTNPTPNG